MGAFAASALATFERATGRRIVEHFDLITGTSTGGIIAIGLAMGTRRRRSARFYEMEGPKIFPKRSGIGMARPREGRLPTEVLERSPARAIRGVVGDRPLKEAKTRLVIPTYDVNTGKVYLFKTPHHPWYPHHADLPAVDVALATSAAPTYFPAHYDPRPRHVHRRRPVGQLPGDGRRGRGARFPGPGAGAGPDAEPQHDELPVPPGQTPINSAGWWAGHRRSSTRSCSARPRRP